MGSLDRETKRYKELAEKLAKRRLMANPNLQSPTSPRLRPSSESSSHQETPNTEQGEESITSLKSKLADATAQAVRWKEDYEKASEKLTEAEDKIWELEYDIADAKEEVENMRERLRECIIPGGILDTEGEPILSGRKKTAYELELESELGKAKRELKGYKLAVRSQKAQTTVQAAGTT